MSKTFKQFLIEYINPGLQTARFNGVTMSHKAKKQTDRVFGNKNKIIEPVLLHTGKKSDIHIEVEKHIGKDIPIGEYMKGQTPDEYGRPTKIGKSLKYNDPLMRKFANDPTRTGAKQEDPHHVSIVRGLEVAGQTNSEPSECNPNGHSWKNESCKNIVDGSNRGYLVHEIKHGTVVVFGHDHKGKEIYRATLHPHYNKEGKTAYAIDSEYGITHPAFTAHAHDVARRLSDEHSGSPIYSINPHVYNNSRNPITTNPNITKGDIEHTIKNDTVPEN